MGKDWGRMRRKARRRKRDRSDKRRRTRRMRRRMMSKKHEELSSRLKACKRIKHYRLYKPRCPEYNIEDVKSLPIPCAEKTLPLGTFPSDACGSRTGQRSSTSEGSAGHCLSSAKAVQAKKQPMLAKRLPMLAALI